MPEPISASTANGVAIALAIASTAPWLDPIILLGAFAGALLFGLTSEEKIVGRVILLFLTSFICGLLAADVTVQILAKLLPTDIEINKGVGAIIAAALAVKILKVAMNLVPAQLGTLFGRIGKGGENDPR